MLNNGLEILWLSSFGSQTRTSIGFKIGYQQGLKNFNYFPNLFFIFLHLKKYFFLDNFV